MENSKYAIVKRNIYRFVLVGVNEEYRSEIFWDSRGCLGILATVVRCLFTVKYQPMFGHPSYSKIERE